MHLQKEHHPVTVEHDRFNKIERIPKPHEMRELYPLSPEGREVTLKARQALLDIMDTTNPHPRKLIVIVGPCSLDDLVLESGIHAVLEYANNLVTFLRADPLLTTNLEIVMRPNEDKTRSKLGWRGLGHSNPQKAYELMTAIVNTGLPIATEVMSPRPLQYYNDMLAMAWGGARNVADNNMRDAMAAFSHDEQNGKPIPLFVKNGTDGNLTDALNAREYIHSPNAKKAQRELGITFHNAATGNYEQHLRLRGNQHVGILMRGGSTVPTPEAYEAKVREFAEASATHGFPLGLDASHGGAEAHGGKHEIGERECLNHILELRERGQLQALRAIMFESHLYEGGKNGAGTSQTDRSIGIHETFDILMQLAKQQQEMHAM
ncbi:MAG: hypothetical protein ACREGJ_01885 [Candidatus Saccharimonadales bacterium]